MDFFFEMAVKLCNVGCLFLEMKQHELATQVHTASIRSIQISQEVRPSESRKAEGEMLKQLLVNMTQKANELQDMSSPSLFQRTPRRHAEVEDVFVMCTKPITISVDILALLLQPKALPSTKKYVTSIILFNLALSIHLVAACSPKLKSQRTQQALKLYQLATKTLLAGEKDSTATKATRESHLMVGMALQNNMGVLHQQFAEFSRCSKCFDTILRLSPLKALKASKGTREKDSLTKIGAENFAIIMLNVMVYRGGVNQFAPVA